ncbi:hypothetical protein HELRODRAFT_175308 [Helobdella robusta]|uniref:Uncharacterized protein n=1 Tax=Helobdella robusta TaxID=6412 RepID=T1F947_HELRO|nr:hypothetical protein HELRODRAFT_175308 [Helobdella robusta]ESO00820.1 hypothetical protein HELRODRAFT_175308 [Helobdella robusta]
MASTQLENRATDSQPPILTMQHPSANGASRIKTVRPVTVKSVKRGQRNGSVDSPYRSVDNIYMRSTRGASSIRRKQVGAGRNDGEDEDYTHYRCLHRRCRCQRTNFHQRLPNAQHHYRQMERISSRFGESKDWLNQDVVDDVSGVRNYDNNDGSNNNNNNVDCNNNKDDHNNINNNINNVLDYPLADTIHETFIDCAGKNATGREHIEVHTTDHNSMDNISIQVINNIGNENKDSFHNKKSKSTFSIFNIGCSNKTKPSKPGRYKESKFSKKCNGTFLLLKASLSRLDISRNNKANKAEDEHDIKFTDSNISDTNGNGNINNNFTTDNNFKTNPNRTVHKNQDSLPQRNKADDKAAELDSSLDGMLQMLTDKCLTKLGKSYKPMVEVVGSCNSLAKSATTKHCGYLKRHFLSKHLVSSCQTPGLYVSCLQSRSGKLLATSNNILPTVKVNVDHVADIENHFYWLMKASSDWRLVKSLKTIFKKEIGVSKKMDTNVRQDQDTFAIKYAILKAVRCLQKLTRNEDLGKLHCSVFKENSSSVFLFVNEIQDASSSSSSSSPSPSSSSHVSLSPLVWMSTDDLSSSSSSPSSSLSSSPSKLPLLKCIASRSSDILSMSEGELKEGMYVGYLKLSCRVQGLDILVSKQHLSSFPSVQLDDEDGVDREDNFRMLMKDTGKQNYETEFPVMEKQFKEMLLSKCNQLIDAVDTQTSAATSSAADDEVEIAVEPATPAAHRLNKMTFTLNNQVTMTLLAPPASLVCQLLQDQLPNPPPSCTYLPLRTFEMIHLHAYQPQIYRKFSKLSTILDLLSEVCRRRKLILEASDISDSRDEELTELLEISACSQGIQREMIEALAKNRWLAGVIRQARLPSSKDFLPLIELF